MNLEQIKRIMQAAIDEAELMDVNISVAFVDDGGHLRAFLRMDDACWGDVDFAINKAYTAAAWRTDSGDFYESSLPSGDFFGMHFSNNLKVTTFPGGMPVYYQGKLIGAIGVSGGLPEEDKRCLEAVKKTLQWI